MKLFDKNERIIRKYLKIKTKTAGRSGSHL